MSLLAFAGNRQEEAVSLLKNGQMIDDDRVIVFSGLVMADLKNYSFMNQLSEADQVSVVLSFSEVLKNDFVLLTGKERSVDFDRQDLISVVKNIPMDEATMESLLDSLSD